MSRRFAIQWLVISILWFMLSSANAAPSALQRISKNADRFLWLGSHISNWKLPPLRELSIAGSTDKQVTFDGKLLLGRHEHKSSDSGVGIFEGKLSNSNDGIRFPRLSAHFTHIDLIVGDEWNTLDDGTVKFIGYNYLDFRADELNNDVEGFVAHHLHVIGFEFPVFSTSIGIGDIGISKTGNFKQADLDAWAGKDADFSYHIFHEGSLGFTWMPLRKNGPLVKGTREKRDYYWDEEGRYRESDEVSIGPNGDPGNFVVDFHVKQARTIGGDIDFPDGMDGDFTAIWEELALQAAQRVWGNSFTDDHQISILAELRLYRQRINAKDEAGNSFSSRQDGSKALVKLQLLFADY